MNIKLTILAFALTAICYSKICRAASIVPLDNPDEEALMKELVSFERRSEVHEPSVSVAEKRYSEAEYTSQRSNALDRAAVRRLLSMLMGKRTQVTAEKRSGLTGLTELPAFDDVKGYVILAGRITSDILDEAVDHTQQIGEPHTEK